MGMFDYLNCEYPLPVEVESKEGFQTKDTPAQICDLYEIREDGTLWHEEYGIEDHSDPNAEGWERIIGSMTRVNKRWAACDLTGQVLFYTFKNEENQEGWIAFLAHFEKGKIHRLDVVENRDD